MKPSNENIFYVYEHWRPDLDVCFYVGKGHGKRAYRFKRGRHYNRTIKKLSRMGTCAEVRLVASNLTEAAAFALEIERIAFWRSVGVSLTNRTDGGEGVRGKMHGMAMKAAHARPETKERHRAAVTKAHARPETKDKHRAACRIGQNRPDVRAQTSFRMVAIRSDIATEEKRRSTLKATLALPEVKARKSRAMIEVRSRPGMNEKIRSGIKSALADPEVRKKLSATTSGRRWINDGSVNRRLPAQLPLPQGWLFGMVS